jgi:hypothetical protein
MADAAHERADQSVSASFTRVMNATTSRWGFLTDPSIVGVAIAPFAVGALAAVRLEAGQGITALLEVLAVLPALVGLLATLGLRGARANVVAWLAAQPFPIENMNAVLNGLGEALEVTFRARAPDVKTLNDALDRVSPDCFVSKGTEDTKDERVLEIRIGIVDSKRNPSGSHYRRFKRVKALVADILLPLADESAVVEVRVK